MGDNINIAEQQTQPVEARSVQTNSFVVDGVRITSQQAAIVNQFNAHKQTQLAVEPVESRSVQTDSFVVAGGVGVGTNKLQQY